MPNMRNRQNLYGDGIVKKKRRRTFFSTFLLTGMFLLAFAGLGSTDVICRHMAFADGQTFYKTHLRPLVVWQKPVCKFTDLWYNQFVNIVCPEALED
jgi:hypothetical protein